MREYFIYKLKEYYEKVKEKKVTVEMMEELSDLMLSEIRDYSHVRKVIVENNLQCSCCKNNLKGFCIFCKKDNYKYWDMGRCE